MENTYYFVLREDLTYSPDTLFNIITDSLPLLYPMQSNKYETYFMFNLLYLDKLEQKLINDGILFNWIDNKGILIYPNNSVKSRYLNDCLSLKEYSNFRKEQFYLFNSSFNIDLREDSI